jgi:hypothetical protein
MNLLKSIPSLHPLLGEILVRFLLPMLTPAPPSKVHMSIAAH